MTFSNQIFPLNNKKVTMLFANRYLASRLIILQKCWRGIGHHHKKEMPDRFDKAVNVSYYYIWRKNARVGYVIIEIGTFM